MSPASAPDFLESALALVDAGKLEEARAVCDAMALKVPDDPDLEFLIAAIDLKGSKPAAAVARLETLATRPDAPQTYLATLGSAYLDLGEDAKAADTFRRAMALWPDLPALRRGLGVALRRLADADEALNHLEQAANANPNDVDNLNDLGVALRRAGRREEAHRTFRRALSLDPNHWRVRLNLAKSLKDDVRQEEALMEMRRVISDSGDAQHIASSAIWQLPVIAASESGQDSAWNAYCSAVAELDAIERPVAFQNLMTFRTNFLSAYQGRNDRANQERIAAFFRRNCPELTYRAKHIGRRGRARPRIGIVVLDPNTRSTSRMFSGILTRIDTKRFELFIFADTPPAGPMGAAIVEHADHFVILPRDLAAARETVAEAALDLLLYTDIGMNPLSYFLAFARLARRQCATWGHGVTTGIDSIDDYVSGGALDVDDAPRAATHYSERLVRFELIPGYFERPEYEGAIDLDGDALKTLYLCPHALFKIHPAFDAAMNGIAERDPDARFLFISDRSEWIDRIRTRWRAAYPGLDARVRFVTTLPQYAFNGLLRAAAIVLDPVHCAGGMTSINAFGLNVPVVAIPGPLMPSRGTTAFYRQLGIDGAVARDREEYVRLAVELANDPARRDELAAAITDHAGNLFGRAEPIAELEEYFAASVSETAD